MKKLMISVLLMLVCGQVGAENVSFDVKNGYASQYTSYCGTTVNVTLTNRTFTAGEWTGVCFPFSATKEQLDATFGEGKYTLEQFSSIDGNTINFSIMQTPTVAAGTPYILKVNTTIENPTFSGVTFASNLDNDNTSNAFLRYNYEDLFIAKIGFGYSWSKNNTAFKTNVETSGNLLSLGAKTFGAEKDDQGHYRLFDIAFAQYAKFDVDLSHSFRIDQNNQLVLHMGFGIAYPYGNSNVLPFEKRYFSGGANSVRGWTVRSLGPGKYKEKDGRINFINQTGDMKLDLNAEYRTKLFWKFSGALFVDAGNVWTLRDYEAQPGGQFHFNTFYEQLAASYGLGLRLNFDYFILRFDMGMKAVNPAFEIEDDEHYPIIHPRLSRDFAFHFAVGMPF